MKRTKILLVITFLSLLSSCQDNYIRSDIKEFIASFSLEDSVKEYKNAGYIKTTSVDNNGKKSQTVENLSFNVTDAAHPKYQKEVKEYEEEVLKETKIEKVTEEDGKFYFTSFEGEKTEYSLAQVHELVEDYFYTTVEATVVHLGGMYYGDYIRQIISAAQQYVTIDTEHSLYVYDVGDTHTNETGDEVRQHQTYSINKLGMLVKNFLSRERDYLKVITEIETYNNL